MFIIENYDSIDRVWRGFAQADTLECAQEILSIWQADHDPDVPCRIIIIVQTA